MEVHSCDVPFALDLPTLCRAFQASDGSFHEGLSRSLMPLDLGRRRVLSQARMIYACLQTSLLCDDSSFIEAALRGARSLEAQWSAGHGAYNFAFMRDGQIDSSKDLYAHAFVVFAYSWLGHISGEATWIARAEAVIDFLEAKFRSRHGGFIEALEDDASILLPRRQNPHMHLLEALLAMLRHQQGKQERIVRLIDELLVLFDQHFYRGDGTLREYFGNSWHLDENRGHEVEAGHHFEWAWLLAECAELLDRPHLRDVAHDLYRWGERYGWDQVYGGYFDALDNHGALHIATKRIWPLCEAIKAAARLGEGHLVRNVNFLNLHYCVDGAWREHLYRNLGLMTEHLPATTLYHLTFAMSEVKKAANHG